MSVWHLGHKAFPSERATTQTGHVGLGPGFINEYQPIWIHAQLFYAPERAGFCDIRPILLAGVDRLFLYVSFNWCSALQMAHGVTVIPNRSRSSTKVASGRSLTSSFRRSRSIFRTGA